MTNQVFPTKSNLIQTQKSLDLAKLGYDIMDKKRNVLIREMMNLIDEAKEIQNEIDETYKKAYSSLQAANITHGLCDEIAESVSIEKNVSVETKSVMGISLPTIRIKTKEKPRIYYGFESSSILLDEAYLNFTKVKMLTLKLAEIENSVYRLAYSIKKTQKRANALKNIMIPKLTADIKYIIAYLEEKEREEFSRLKVIKSQKEKNKE